MAYVLSVWPQSPLKRSFSDNPYLSSCSPVGQNSLTGLRDFTPRNASSSSIYSLGSGAQLRGTENSPPPLTSRSLLDLSHDKDGLGPETRSLHGVPRKRGCGSGRPIQTIPRSEVHYPISRKKRKEDSKGATSSNCREDESVRSDFNNESDNDAEDNVEILELYEAIKIPLPEGRFTDSTANESDNEPQDTLLPMQASPQLFRRWMSTLRRRHIRREMRVTEAASLPVDKNLNDIISTFPCRHVAEATHRTSDSLSSSMGFVTAVRSASMTIASASIAPRSEAGRFQSNIRVANRGSNFSEARKSTDSNTPALGSVLDESAWLRSIQRRNIVEELISSEEGYIGDLKVLINDYFMFLPSVPALSTQTRTSIQHNISQILQLHQELLAELYLAAPQVDVTRTAQQEAYPVTKARHIRFHSADLIPGKLPDHRLARGTRHSLEIGRSPDRRPEALAANTLTAGKVANVFNKHMKRFFIYEEYGAHWTTMSQDLTTMYKGRQGWLDYERGIEALSKLLASENNRESSSRKALGFADLLIKPIQRVCKYPLLFEDLCRHTPVYDDPEAHEELEKALFRFQETLGQVNKAKDDPKTRRLIEISWQLQDRLVFQEQSLSQALIFRLLGHVLACGVLHVAYQAPDRVKGQYMICILYKSCLILATASRLFTPYNVVATIALANASVEKPDNGRGIQCHTAPHSWKLVFEHGHRLHEVILSACSTQEEETWKQQLCKRIVCETQDFVEGRVPIQDMFSSLSLEIKSIGPVFGHADGLVRRMSVHRAATLGSRAQISQVIIKNTQAQRSPDPPSAFIPATVTRSQSHMSTNHVPTLAPRRAERVRLETALDDVWTKDILPFPGMSARRTENPIRASANSVMRKLSMASIASNFSRRTPSFSSLSNTRSEDSFGSKANKISQRNLRAHSATERRPAPAVVDFHSAPAAFLPTDFELQEVRPSGRRRRRLANKATGTERSSEKTTPTNPMKTRRLSTHINNIPGVDLYHRLDTTAIPDKSKATLLGIADASVPREESREHDMHIENGKVGSSRRRASSNALLAKRSLKSKSRIFKFWM